MKIFISWSGERSLKVAELMSTWLKCVIQAADPWISSQDLDRGSIWFNDILNELSGSGIGIICLTKENLNKPWILFEAGAIAKGIGVSKNKVCTFLIDLEPTDVFDPLAQFNHTIPNKEGMKSLIITINNMLKEKTLKDHIINQVFETYWPEFESKFNEILKSTPNTETTIQPENNSFEEARVQEYLPEIISSLRNIDRRLFTLEQNKRITTRQRPSYDLVVKFINSFADWDKSKTEIIELVCEKFDVTESFVINHFEELINNKVVPF